MRAGITAFSCGIILLYWVGFVPPLLWLTVAILLTGALYVLAPRSVYSQGAFVLLATLAGLSWAAWHAETRLAHWLPVSLEGQTLGVSGYVCDVPESGVFNSVRFSLCVDHWHGSATGQLPAAGSLPKKLKLAWYGQRTHTYIPHAVNLSVTLKRPHGAANPSGFSYEGWLFRHGYGATGTVRDLAAAPDLRCGLVCSYHRWRGGFARELQARWGNVQQFPLVQSLLIGERGELKTEHWRVLKATGTIHLVAISGLHLGLIALGTGWVARRTLLRLPAHWLTPSQARVLLFGVVLSTSIVYALAAGFAVPTRRALIMIAVAGWMLLAGRYVSVWLGWLMALFLTLLTDPFSPLDRGFWLSFLAVAVLILMFSRRVGRPGWLASLVLAQCAIFIGLWPALALMEQSPAVVGMVANIVAVPWVSVVVMPVLMLGALLAALVPAFAPLAGLAFDGVLMPLWWFLALLAEVPALSWSLAWIEVLALALLSLVALLFPDRSFRLAVVGFLVFWGVAGAGREEVNRAVSQPELWVWDVGQGLSVLLRDQDKTLVYDTGPEYASGYSAVDGVLLPNFRRLGVRHIDQLVISHGDLDHAGGLAQLNAAVTLGAAYTGEPERIAERLPGAQACPVGKKIMLGRVELSFWQDSQSPPARWNSNDASCVVIARYGSTMLILPGDISRRTEERLLEALEPDPERSLVVVAAHHGSRTSSGERWVEGLQPDYVVYSAGYRHRFGHPHADVVARYDGVASRGFNTAQQGAIQFRLLAEGVAVQQARAGAPFWMEPSSP